MLEERALRATTEVFGEKGWAGLTIDEVAARAHVGKSSIYLRWKDKETLLAAALRHTQQAVARAGTVTDGGASPADGAAPATAPAAPDHAPAVEPTPADAGPITLRDYLVAHATSRAELYLATTGLAMLRLYVEARAHPEVFTDIRREAITDFVIEERRRVEEAVAQGELPPGTSPVQILDAIEGSVLMHILVTPPHLLDRVRTNLPEYIDQMVDAQLRAAGAVPLSLPGS